jgi:hypothetical protein
MPTTAILGAASTPVGKLGGGLSAIDAIESGATAISAALVRPGVASDEVQHVVMGQVLQAGKGQVPSRQAQIKAGIPSLRRAHSRHSRPRAATPRRRLGLRRDLQRRRPGRRRDPGCKPQRRVT